VTASVHCTAAERMSLDQLQRVLSMPFSNADFSTPCGGYYRIAAELLARYLFRVL
jgi:hypothetical protein